MTTQPGPASISPGEAPDGLVVHAYSLPDESLIFVRRLTPDCDVEAAAEGDADRETPHRAVWLVFYDGDSGERISPVGAILGGVLQDWKPQ